MIRDALRRTGVDPPFSDHRHYHGVPMEGWFWRLTDAAAGTVVVVLAGVCRDLDGRTWGMTAVALHAPASATSPPATSPPAGPPPAAPPPAVFAEGIADEAWADPRGPSLRIGDLLEADDEHLRVSLPDAEVEISFEEAVGWPKRALGGIGPGHLVPWLGQYWHPHVLGGGARGSARVGETVVDVGGAAVYAEKNWGRGFPKGGWWWGQAQGFGEDVCVAFAGGPLGPLAAGALVVRVGDELVHVVRPPLPLRTRPGWSLRARTARCTVEIDVETDDEPLRLPVPVPRERGVVHGPSAQHLSAELRLTVCRRARTVFSGVSGLAGFELGTPS